MPLYILKTTCYLELASLVSFMQKLNLSKNENKIYRNGKTGKLTNSTMFLSQGKLGRKTYRMEQKPKMYFQNSSLLL